MYDKAGWKMYKVTRSSAAATQSTAGKLYSDQKDKMCPENWTIGTKMSEADCGKKVALYDIN